MPAGWRPRGLPAKEMVEITTENQIRFRPPMFAGAKIYLIAQVILGIGLMMGIISNLYAWTNGEKWIAAFLLWWQIINWGGILEAKAWIWISENLRVISTVFTVIIFSEIYAPSPLLFGLIFAACFSIIWTNLYFRPTSAKLAMA
jgi:hypothetical protein